MHINMATDICLPSLKQIEYIGIDVLPSCWRNANLCTTSEAVGTTVVSCTQGTTIIMSKFATEDMISKTCGI